MTKAFENSLTGVNPCSVLKTLLFVVCEHLKPKNFFAYFVKSKRSPTLTKKVNVGVSLNAKI
jgi:hypothetical protein